MSSDERIAELAQRLLEGARDPSDASPAVDDDSTAELAESFEALGAVALSADAQQPSLRMREAVLQAADPDAWIAGYVDRVAGFYDIDRDAARVALESLHQVDRAPWFDDPNAEVRLRVVPAGPRLAGAACLLVHMEAGAVYPVHRHLGDEWCLFLRGQIRENDTEWRPGDLVRNAADSVHPVLEAHSDGPCVFALALYEGAEFP